MNLQNLKYYCSSSHLTIVTRLKANKAAAVNDNQVMPNNKLTGTTSEFIVILFIPEKYYKCITCILCLMHPQRSVYILPSQNYLR